ncbi:unnamed protein product [Effrenium voratum]|nr:unnamed protein product [Effrenium voratum]
MYEAKKKGFPISLYLDAKERRYVEEFNTSNFVGITKDGKYITPDAARSVLNSNTNKVGLRGLRDSQGLITSIQQSWRMERRLDKCCMFCFGDKVKGWPCRSQSWNKSNQLYLFDPFCGSVAADGFLVLSKSDADLVLAEH